MAERAFPQSLRGDKTMSYHERRLYRASLRSPLRFPSLADGLQSPKSTNLVDSASPYGRQDAPKSEVKGQAKSRVSPIAEPAQQLAWPPDGRKLRSYLTFDEAQAFVSKGAPVFKGFEHQLPNITFRHSRFYAFAGLRTSKKSLEVSCKASPLTEDMSFALAPAFERLMPWETLEQPSMTVCFGALPGTMCLNYWVGSATRRLPQSETASGIIPRPVELDTILVRLQSLEHGLDEDPESMEIFLYSQLLYDPDMIAVGQNDIGQQIAALVAILDTYDWINFADPEDQVTARLYDSDNPNESHLFYHQLLLSIELHLRIQGSQSEDSEKRRFLSKLPDRVQWSVALAMIWLSNVSIKQTHVPNPENSWDVLPLVQVIPLDKLVRIRQVEQLGWALKWPNMGKVCEVLYSEAQGDMVLESSSAQAKSFLSGVILPGLSSSWLAMKCLIDCDTRDGYKLETLSARHPQSGFQYHNATYWYWSSIVGKVLGAAKGVSQHGGWIGPCMYSPDFELCTSKHERVHCVIVDPVPVSSRLTKQKIKNMEARSEAIGPGGYIRVNDFKVVSPQHEVVDTIRIEKLACPVGEKIRKCSCDEPSIFNVAIKFAIDGASYALRLRHDTSYIKAVPCDGPHVLFHDYTYKAIRVDGLLEQACWGGVDARNPVTATAFDPRAGPGPSDPGNQNDVYDNEAVLVVEAFGVADNDVFARAWCSYMGLSAIVANIEETCMACAIREAYAACVTVVILIQGGKNDDVEGVECSPPWPLETPFSRAG